MSDTRVPKSATPWRLLALLMAMTAMGPVALNILVPAIPQLARVLETDSGTVQLTVSLFLLSLATAQLLLGPLSDRFGRRPVVLAGLSLAVVASFAAIATTSINALIIARIIQAMGAATGVVIGRAIIRDLFERDRAASMLGLVATAMVVAPMVAPLIGGILDTAFGWHAIFLFVALFSLVVLIWAYVTLPETAPAPTTEKAQARLWSDWGALLISRNFHGYVLAASLGSAQFFTFIGGGPHVVVTQMGRSSAEYGLWFAITSLGYMAGNFAASRLSQRYGVNAMIIYGTAFEIVGAAIGVAVVAMFPDAGPAVIFLPQIIISFGNGVLLPNAIAGAVSVRPHAAGAASGITGFVQMAIGALAAQFIPYALVGSATPMPMALALLAFGIATMMAFLALVRR